MNSLPSLIRTRFNLCAKVFTSLLLMSASLLTSTPTVAAAPAVTTIGLSNLPLFSSQVPHPNVVVSLSVEFPTAGRAYTKDQLAAFIPYVATNEYLGYFNNKKCYTYSVSSPAATSTRTPASVQASNEYFYSTGDSGATDHTCSGKFSGNYLNWASMSAIDELRLSLTGGNRIVDLNGSSDAGGGAAPQTVLLRAYLPDGSISGVNNFFTTDSTNINWPPSHTSSSAAATDGSYAKVAPSSVTPYSDSDLYTTGCRNLLFIGKTLGGSSCDSPIANRGIYRIAVQVCDANENTTRTDLCQRYTSGSPTLTTYKPVGQVQIYSDSTRFAVFGYLMDRGSSPSGCDDSSWNECRYGGVLRNPMKYVGAKQYDAALAASTNANKEINDDGTFVTNPDANAVVTGGLSGFINYINTFGSSGLYKRRDPVGELYYEAIRYLAHLPETPEAITPDPISGTITNAFKDNFPIITGTGWTTDPMLNQCQKNFIINVGDANTNDDWYLPGFAGGKTYRPSSVAAIGGIGNLAGFDAVTATNKVGTFESRTNLATTTISNGSYLIAGAAYWANVNDIRADLPGKQTIKTISFDVAELVDSGPGVVVKDRQLYLAGKYGGFNDKNGDGDPTKTTDATGATVTNNSEWESSPGSAYPANYYLASDPDKLIKGLKAAFAQTQSTTGTISGTGLSSSNIAYSSAGAFTVSFDPSKWSGSVAKRIISYDDSAGTFTVSTAAIWEADKKLDAFIGTTPSSIPTNAAARKIFTLDFSNNPRAFDWASLSGDSIYKAYLNTNPSTLATDTLGQNRLNYLRGDRYTDEWNPSGNGFRVRGSAFGDIINSAAVYVGAPSSAIADSAYPTFYAANKSRAATVYVGANDGMLHALSASTGDELFAYVPRKLASKLNKLTDPAYVHTAFVDAVPVVTEAKLGSNWKTVLVSGLGSGAQGMFALDVTAPSSFTTSNILWEFSDSDDADFGYVTSKPLIAKINTAPAGSTPDYKWFAVVTGYNSSEADASVTSPADYRGTIFLLRLDKPVGTAWTLGTWYYKIKTPVYDSAKPNGLGPVAALPNSNGVGDIVNLYVGDLQGNLWKIDLTVGATNWTGTSPVMYGATPLFIAKDGTSAAANRQPITEKPSLAKGPLKGTMVLVGTGQYMGTADKSNYAQQSFYGIFDDGGTTSTSKVSDRTVLLPRTLSNSAGIVTATGSAPTYGGGSTTKGWYIDFLATATTGERSISSAYIGAGVATFSTVTLPADTCGTGGGFVYQLNPITGLPFGTVIGAISAVGIPGPPQGIDLSSGAGKSTSTRGSTASKGQGVIVSGSQGNINLVNFDNPDGKITVRLGQGRVSWREIFKN